MNVVHGKPPNWDELLKFFPDANPMQLVVTYGDTIYLCQPHMKMYPDLLAHEGTHVRQQTNMGAGAWWNRYYTENEFRFEQEIEAFRAQYLCRMKEVKDRNKLAQFLSERARCLSSPMYGSMVKYADAMKLIRNGL